MSRKLIFGGVVFVCIILAINSLYTKLTSSDTQLQIELKGLPPTTQLYSRNSIAFEAQFQYDRCVQYVNCRYHSGGIMGPGSYERLSAYNQYIRLSPQDKSSKNLSIVTENIRHTQLPLSFVKVNFQLNCLPVSCNFFVLAPQIFRTLESSMNAFPTLRPYDYDTNRIDASKLSEVDAEAVCHSDTASDLLPIVDISDQSLNKMNLSISFFNYKWPEGFDSTVSKLDDLEIMPCYNMQRIIGLKIVNLPQSHILAKKGVKESDVIMNEFMEDETLTNPDQLNNILQKLYSNKETRLIVLRDESAIAIPSLSDE